MRIDLRNNFDQVEAALNIAQRQVPFALARAMNLTGKDVIDAERDEMSNVFDRPTPFTLNSLRLRPATKQDLTAVVDVRDSQRPNHFILPQIHGGARLQKRFEELLVQRGVMRADERAVPALGAELDAYGNMTRGQIVRILSQLQAFNVAGFDANATNSKRSKAKRQREAFFVSQGPGKATFGRHSWSKGRKLQHLQRGIWARIAFGATGSAVMPVLLFVSRAMYQPRYRFEQVAQATISRVFARHFDESFAAALRTARPGGGA
ncbi:hypothetical protein J2789_004478 [Variovorax paradoxus]|uniref:hypothetical protein n=1 Tax=Variovorax atrisoli TaxID=3394203 RepID=UPI00119C1379|nr:hypothetical protein [Variovorax paradoxus]MDR6521788.1 hypothetical protein [Variovorax paradoxus]